MSLCRNMWKVGTVLALAAWVAEGARLMGS